MTKDLVIRESENTKAEGVCSAVIICHARK